MIDNRYKASGDLPVSVDYKNLTYYYDDSKDLYANVNDTTLYIDTDGSVKTYEGDNIVDHVNIKGSLLNQGVNALFSQNTLDTLTNYFMPTKGNTSNSSVPYKPTTTTTTSSSGTTILIFVGVIAAAGIGFYMYNKKK